ncbi:MAG: Lrp/AsnC ligand binding domain-containing protein [Chloroflexota bacterium]
MVTAIILCNVDRRRIPETAQRLLEVPEVTEVYSVAGDYDIVAIVRVHQHEHLADVVTERMAAVETITHTHTLIAYKAFSQHDLERLFSIGADDSLSR